MAFGGAQAVRLSVAARMGQITLLGKAGDGLMAVGIC